MRAEETGGIDRIDGTEPWTFDEKVTKVFSNMISRSIPDYGTMRTLSGRLACDFLRDGARLLDLGCSNGLSVESIVREYDDRIKYVLCDVSKPMLEQCRDRYAGLISNGCMNVVYNDLRHGLPEGNYDVIQSILTVQLTPIEHRKKIIKSVYDSLNRNGCFIYVEKVLADSSELDSLFVDEYYRVNREHGYTAKQIEDKRKSLEHQLTPLTERWNIDMLRSAGFRYVECFWRCLNFCAWIAVKK